MTKHSYDESFVAFAHKHLNIYAFEPGTAVGACQPSRWAVTLVDVHTLGALLLAPQSFPSGQWLPYRGHDTLQLLSFPPLCTKQEVIGLNPETGKVFSTQILILKAEILPHMLTFLSNLLSVLFSLRNTTVSFFPFFLLPLPSDGKNHTTPINTPILSSLFPIQSTPRTW